MKSIPGGAVNHQGCFLGINRNFIFVLVLIEIP